MKIILKKILIISSIIMVSFLSCRKEEIELIQPPTDEILVANSVIASLMQKTSSNDGSKDNIIDKSNCFNIKLPAIVTANGNNITVNSKQDYKIIEYIFDEKDDDYDTLSISYPITIILEDYSEIIINTPSELSNYSINCNGENEYDDDIECLDFEYPISASLFNTDNELINTFSFNSDINLNDFLKNLNSNDIVAINFPFNVILSDNTQIPINNLNELEDVINVHKNDCDEDDDYDYNDDDCNDCNTNQLSSLLTSCSDWTIDKLKRYNNNYDDYYDGYTFNFYTNGTISIYYQSNSYYGTWLASGSGNSLVVTINVPDLPRCNNDWILHEISQYSESKIDLRVGDSDRMRYNNNCN